MSRQITRRRAEQALAAVKTQFKAYIDAGYDEPKLCEPGYHARSWTIAWDGGPEEWSTLAFNPGAVDPEMYSEARFAGINEEAARRLAKVPDEDKCPAGVFAEPINYCILGLYPED